MQGWGEVIINHMVSDTIRSLPVVKRPKAIEKYSRTYKMDLDDLISIKGDRQEFERIITSIIFSLRTNHKRSLYISSFPFFNSCNAVIYNLIHCTGSIVGFKLFKKTAWQVFGRKSSSKKTYGSENQLMFSLDNSNKIQTDVDEDCYHVQDIAAHVHKHFRGREDVPLKEVWALLDRHPIFPSEGFADSIKRLLREIYGDSIKRSSITFTDKE